MQYQTIILEKKEDIATLTLNRPQRLNAANHDMLRELGMALQDASQDDNVKVVVLTGAGLTFCSGADVAIVQEMMNKSSQQEVNPRHGLSFIESWYSFVLQLSGMVKPVVASVNGMAAGGGLVLAMVADVRIASDKASFSQIFARRGLPDGASTFFLPKLIGIGRACELAFLGDAIDAKEAERIGLVNKVVPHEELGQSTKELAARIAAGPPIALQLIKQALHRGLLANDLVSHIAYELNTVLISTATEDFKEGVISFLEKREPTFQGK